MTDATVTADGAMPIGLGRFASRIPTIAGFSVVGLALVGALAAAVVYGPARDPAPSASAHIKPAGADEVPAGPEVEDTPDAKAVLQGLLTKAGLGEGFDIHRLNYDQARRLNDLMPAQPEPDDFARPFVLSTDTAEGRAALHCLTQAAYFEAGANGPEAQAGVVQVVLNRVRHPAFPKSVCGVVYQGSQRKTGCQFSFTCDGALKRALSIAAWNAASIVAQKALAGYVYRPVGASTFYHADYVFPYWAPSLVKAAVVGPHIFYRMAGDAGEAAYLTGRYAGGELRLTKALLRAAGAIVRRRDAVKAAHATVRVAAVRKAERVHTQLAKSEAPAIDAALNKAQTAKPVLTPPVAQPASVAVAPVAKPVEVAPANVAVAAPASTPAA